MSSVNFYILVSFYFIFTLATSFLEYKEICNKHKLEVIDYFKIIFICIYGIVPICSLIMLYTGKSAGLKAFKYLESQNDIIKYVICFLSILFYFVVNKIYEKLYRKITFKRIKFPIIDTESKEFYVSNFIILIIGWIALIAYTRAYGSVFGIFKYAAEIRDNIFRVHNNFTFMQPISQILIWSSLNYVVLLKNMHDKSVGYKISTIMLSMLSFFGYFIILISNDGRMTIFGQILIICYFLLHKSKIKFSNMKRKHKCYIFFFAVSMFILLFQINNITGFIRNDSSSMGKVDYNPIKFTAKEFGYTYVNDINVIDRLVNKHNVDIRIDDDIFAATITYIPRRYKKVLVQDLFRYNTSFTYNPIGLIPTDVISASFYSLSYFGYILFMLWIPIVIIFVQRFFDKNTKNGDFYILLFPYLAIFMVFRLVAYYDLSDLLYCCFPLVISLVIMLILKMKIFKNIIDKLYYLFSNSHLFIIKLMNNGCFNWLSDEKYLKLRYYFCFNKKLNLNNPQTFNEKLQWLKLNDRKDIYTTMVDKYEAKEYIKNIIGEKYIVPTFGIYDKFEDIDFDNLPNQFVIKCTHDSGGLIIVKDKSKLDLKKAKKKIDRCFRHNYYLSAREWPYKNVKRRIIVEQLLENKSKSDLLEYNFFCFNGVAKIFMICHGDKHAKRYNDFYDMDFNKLDFKCSYDCSDKIYKKPKYYDEMLNIAEMLSKNIPCLRVDFYVVDNKIKIGELTFFHWGGFGKFEPKIWDKNLGNMLDLSLVKKDEK